MSRPLICAHRGASAHHADNSADAFAAAIAAGADLVETDIRRGPRGDLVLAHDPISEDEQPMALVELLRLARGRVGLDLELKEAGLERAVLALLEPAHREGLIVTSFLPEVIAELRRLDATLDLGLLVEEVPGAPVTGLLSAARACGAGFLAPDVAMLGPEARRAAHALGRGLSVWTVNDAETLTRLADDPDIAIITTDVPALARSIVG
ncbi:MAG: glycerophosphoryl diester phosphodiesterase [Gaiellaceae bacterium]|nr:glycerophosphoryl diester phosphodiesterase [Gaiellaceae bacterium]